MNKFEILKLIELKIGVLPTKTRLELLEIYEAYNNEINQLDLKKNQIFTIDMMFYHLHKKGVRDNRFSLLSESLNSGIRLSRVIKIHKTKNKNDSDFLSDWFDCSELEQLNSKQPDSTIEIIIKDSGKGRKAKIKNKPKGST